MLSCFVYLESGSRLVFTFSAPRSVPLPHRSPLFVAGRGSRPDRDYLSNSHGISIFADPHPLTPVESYRFKNSGRRGWSRRFTPTLHKSFSCNTYGSPRKCCKQKTYDLPKSFRCNTYKKPGGYIFQAKSRSLFRQTLHPFLTSLPPYFITSRAALGAAGSPASGRRWRW